MIRILTVDNMRKSDAAAIVSGVPSRELMRRAAEGIFKAAEWKGPTAILCGTGNNAGDGYALALYMKDAGIDCRLFLTKEIWSEDGRYYFDRCKKAGIVWKVWQEGTDLSSCGSVCDCIFGTGFHGTARGIAADMIASANKSGAYVVSADIPSGLNGDTGRGEPCINSDLTVAIGDFKPGHFIGDAKRVIKKALRVDIGIEPQDPPWLYADGKEAKSLYAKLKKEDRVAPKDPEADPEEIRRGLPAGKWTVSDQDRSRLIITAEQIYLLEEMSI